MDRIEKLIRERSPKAVVTKTIDREKERYNIWIHYGNEYLTMISLIGETVWKGNTRQTSLFKTEQEVAEVLKKQLERDRKASGLPNMEYDITVKINYIINKPGTPKEESTTQKNIEKLLVD